MVAVGHDDRQHRAPGERHRQRRAPPALQAVEQRPDHRRDDGEGRHGDREVEGDVRLALGGRRGEEQRVGQRDGDGGVERVARHRRVGQRGEPRAVRAVRGRGAVEGADAVLGDLPAAQGGDAGDGQLAGDALRAARSGGGSAAGASGDGAGRPAAGSVRAGPVAPRTAGGAARGRAGRRASQRGRWRCGGRPTVGIPVRRRCAASARCRRRPVAVLPGRVIWAPRAVRPPGRPRRAAGPPHDRRPVGAHPPPIPPNAPCRTPPPHSGPPAAAPRAARHPLGWVRLRGRTGRGTSSATASR